MSTTDFIDDPFSDRKQGPRTRSKAVQEEKELQTPKAIRVTILPSVSPSSSRFAAICFPSLDGSSVAENEQIRFGRKVEKAAEEEINPFFENEGSYFGEVGSSRKGEIHTSNSNKDLEIKDGGALGFDLSSPSAVYQKPRREINQPEKQGIENYKLHTPTQEAIRYKSFVTRNSVSGELVRWHKRATSSKTSPSPDPGLFRSSTENDNESDSENDPEPYTPHASESEADHPLLTEYLKRRLQNSMAENTAPVVNSDDATRGMPYYEKLKKTLKTSIKQKQDLEETLAKIEQSIWNKEGSYLDETIAGNIMKGFDNYIKASGAQGTLTSGGGTSSRKKATVSEQDRLFSRSSVGFWSSMRVSNRMNTLPV